MNEAQINIAPLTCQLTDLVAFTTDPEVAETILAQDKPFALKATVNFSGSGAIALMPLGLTIRLDFFAVAMGIGEAVELGSASLKTVAGQFTYTPTLKLLKSAVKSSFSTEKIYRIRVLMRVGTPEGPSFIHGFLDNLTVEVYNS